MRLLESAVYIGMVVGLIAAVGCGVSEIEQSGPIMRIIIAASLGAGLVSATIWRLALRDRCDRYERALRKHGIDPQRD